MPQKDADLKAHRMLAFDGTHLGYAAYHLTLLVWHPCTTEGCNRVSRILPRKFLPQAHSSRTELAYPMYPAGMLRQKIGYKYAQAKTVLQSLSVLGRMSH